MRGRERHGPGAARRAPAAIAALVALVALAALAAGCAHSPAPGGWSSTAAEAQSSGYGGWMRLELGPRTLEGELIAVEAESAFVLANRGLVGAPLDSVTGGRLAAYDAQTGGLVTWTLLGTLSTASHGFGLVLSAPVWIIGGSLLTGSATRTPLYDLPQRSWADVRAFARFPAGLPPGLDRAALRPKPGR